MIGANPAGTSFMQKVKLADTIAQAIRKADKRYFFEDYTAQADAVLAALKKAGLTVVPLEPFRQALTSGRRAAAGTSLGLPLAKAMSEANGAAFGIRSAPPAGTLIEVTFPPVRPEMP